MDKRYQVFVSSTFTDLQEERSKILQTLMKMDCIPAGMELFPAADEEQFEFIKKVIDDCDYYLLIIGGRYGSTTKEGISYTEKEYDYAVSKNIKVIALIHKNPDAIPAGKTDRDQKSRKRLEEFRKKVSKGRLVEFWDNSSQLPGMVALNLLHTMKAYPTVGWVRGDQVSNRELLTELNELRKRNEELETSLQKASHSRDSGIGFAGLDETVELSLCLNEGRKPMRAVALTWGNLFARLGSDFLTQPLDHQVHKSLTQILLDDLWIHSLQEQEFHPIFKQLESSGTIDDSDFSKVKFQFLALDLIQVTLGPEIINVASSASTRHREMKWQLTENGYKQFLALKAIKSSKSK